MRGVYTAGTLLGLHAMGLGKLFDNVYGTSGGAVNAGHFLSGLGETKADTYYRYLADGRFINPYRFWRVVDIDFFVDDVLTTFRRLEIELIMASTTPLWVSVVDFISSKPLLLHAQSGEYPVLQVMKAAVALPVLYNKLISLGNLRCFDAGFCNPFPLDGALRHGNSHVLVLLAKGQNYISPPKTWWEKEFFSRCFAHGNRELVQLFERSSAYCNQLRDLAHGRVTPPDADACIATVSPIQGVINRTSQNAESLREEMISSARGILRLFDHSQVPIDEWVHVGKI